MLPKITITVDGPSCQGIGKTTVSQIIEDALRRHGYEVACVAVPGTDNPVPLTAEYISRAARQRAELGRYKIQPENSQPRATVNLIEHT